MDIQYLTKCVRFPIRGGSHDCRRITNPASFLQQLGHENEPQRLRDDVVYHHKQEETFIVQLLQLIHIGSEQ